MPEESVIEGNPSDSAPVRGEGFNSMAAQLSTAMAEFNKPPVEAKPLDTKPVDPPALKKEAKPDKADAKDIKDTKPAADPDPVSPKAADWKKLKAERDEWQKKAAEHETAVKTHAEKVAAIEREYTEFKTKAAIKPEDIEALRKERDEYSTKLERLALAETPRFKQYYEGKFEAAVVQATDAVGKEKADQVRHLLEAPRMPWRKQQLNELIEAMESKVDQLQLLDAVNRYDAARDERAKQLEDHKNGLRELQAVETKQQQEKAEQDVAQRKAVMEQLLKQASEKLEAFKPSDDAVHNALVEQNKQVVEKFIHGKLDPETLWSLPTWAMQGQYLQNAVKEKDAKITELTEALKKYQAAAPALEGSGEAKSSGSEPMSYSDQVRANLASLRQAQQR